MFSVCIAARQRGTIELQSGVLDQYDAVDVITSMTELSELEAIRIISKPNQMGLHRSRGENFEILTKALASDDRIDNLEREHSAGDANESCQAV